MESILSLFIFHDSYVVSFLVFGITIIVVMLLLFNHKSPKSVVRAELDGDDNVEGALRRVLSEKQWVGVGSSGGESSVDQVKLGELEKEVLDKDRAIAELNKKITQGGGGAVVGDDSELMQKIADLEERLQEYEIIEDDIADLSLYRTENEKLKAELARLKAMAGGDVGEVTAPVPVETGEDTVVETPQGEAKVQGADLVAEFEKVVNSQDQINSDTDAEKTENVKENLDSGKVMVKGGQPAPEAQLPIHTKLKDIDPDSKEEAEVFISELKTLKEGLKSE